MTRVCRKVSLQNDLFLQWQLLSMISQLYLGLTSHRTVLMTFRCGPFHVSWSWHNASVISTGLSFFD